MLQYAQDAHLSNITYKVTMLSKVIKRTVYCLNPLRVSRLMSVLFKHRCTILLTRCWSCMLAMIFLFMILSTCNSGKTCYTELIIKRHTVCMLSVSTANTPLYTRLLARQHANKFS